MTKGLFQFSHYELSIYEVMTSTDEKEQRANNDLHSTTEKKDIANDDTYLIGSLGSVPSLLNALLSPT
jgi:hypothetical protein